MAGPETPDNSSYSDPFYDRLDAFFSWLGRRWLIVVVALAVVLVGALTLRYQLSHNPDAISAAALYTARAQGDEALIALSNDADHTVESRARAALDVARNAVIEGNLEAAERHARQASELANQSSRGNLQAAALMTLASVLEEAGQLAPAREIYQSVTERFLGQYPAYVLASEIAQALLAADLAAELEDETEANTLRLEALRILHDYAGQSRDDGSMAIIAAATWRYYDLRRQFPELAASLDQELGISTTEPADTGASAIDEDTSAAEPAVSSDDTEESAGESAGESAEESP